jgi:hypothetical protein
MATQRQGNTSQGEGLLVGVRVRVRVSRVGEQGTMIASSIDRQHQTPSKARQEDTCKRTRQDRTGQDRTEQHNTTQHKARQDKTRRGHASKTEGDKGQQKRKKDKKDKKKEDLPQSKVFCQKKKDHLS